MGKTLRLTETQLNKIVKKVINEMEGGTKNPPFCNGRKEYLQDFNSAWFRVVKAGESFSMKPYDGDIPGNFVVLQINAMADENNPCMIDKKYLFSSSPIPLIS